MIAKTTPPAGSTLAAYVGKAGYVDCYAANVPQAVTQAAFVTAFYQTPLFRLEAWILAVFARRPSTKAQAAALARAEISNFAAWDVEARSDDALMMCDMSGHTRSWLSVPTGTGQTILFGSVVVGGDDGKLGLFVRALMPFHKLYARALLWSAARAMTK